MSPFPTGSPRRRCRRCLARWSRWPPWVVRASRGHATVRRSRRPRQSALTKFPVRASAGASALHGLDTRSAIARARPSPRIACQGPNPGKYADRSSVVDGGPAGRAILRTCVRARRRELARLSEFGVDVFQPTSIPRHPGEAHASHARLSGHTRCARADAERDCARPALADRAADLRAGQPELLVQEMHQRHVARHLLAGVAAAVHGSTRLNVIAEGLGSLAEHVSTLTTGGSTPSASGSWISRRR